MTTVLEEPDVRTPPVESSAERLRSGTAAMRLSFSWFGTRKTLTAAQKAQAAESFGAEGEFLSAGKKLINTRHDKFKAVTAVRSAATSYFKSVSLPFPEPAIRLIRRDDLDEVTRRMESLRSDLQIVVADLNEHYDELKSAARQRLGTLFNHGDYPTSLTGLFDVSWDFPSVEPPRYLHQLAPALYEQECRRVQSRFDEAVQLAESAFMDELSKLTEHLTERLSGQVDGQPKVFRDSVVNNMTEFLDRFRRLNIRSNEQLDAIVGEARQIVQGVRPQQLRDNQTLRQHVAEQLSGVRESLDGLLVDRPRRNIIRKPR